MTKLPVMVSNLLAYAAGFGLAMLAATAPGHCTADGQGAAHFLNKPLEIMLCQAGRAFCRTFSNPSKQ
jgi:hypothetical protein